MSELLEVIGLACNEGGSDKVWGAALIGHGVDAVTMLTVYGKRGIVNGKPKVEDFSTVDAARKQYAAKVKEKETKNPPYKRFDLSLPGYGVLDALVALDPIVRGASAGMTTLQVGPASNGTKAVERRITVSHLSVVKPDQLLRLMTDERYGMAEKANGDRCTVERLADGTLRSYNRKGQLSLTVPEACAALFGGKTPMLIDGERMPYGGYCMFDLLEMDSTSIRDKPFSERITLLEALTQYTRDDMGAGLSTSQRLAPKGLVLLRPVRDGSEKLAWFERIQNEGGEGVVFRDMNGPSIGNSGTSRYELKVKFRAELDAFVLGGKDGRSEGSVRIGLLRPRDSEVIDIGSVSSGFKSGEITRLLELNAVSTQVLRVEFLPARTVGWSLVEPTSSLSMLRTDKTPMECTTDQLVEIFGEDRQAVIDTAPAARL